MPLLPLLLAAAVAAPSDTQAVRVTVAPVRPLIEEGAAQSLNFDFVLENTGADSVVLSAVTLSVHDQSGRLQLRRVINENGPSPGALLLLPDRTLPPGARGMIFNPFPEFPQDIELARLDYELEFRSARGEGTRRTVHVRVEPRRYTTRTRLQLPLRGRILVWDGHDFPSHHRRWNFTHPLLTAHCFTTNAGRYAYDLQLLGADDRPRRGESDRNEDWIGFDAPVLAPAPGLVVAVRDGDPDNGQFDLKALCESHLVAYGNVVVIDHGHGEFSLLAHLRQGSVTVRKGDSVALGQQVGRVGSSGSSLFPHLHYQLVTGAENDAEGLPSAFPDAILLRGSRRVPAPAGRIDSGDIVDGN